MAKLFKQWLLNFLIPPLAYSFILLVGWTLRIKLIEEEEIKEIKKQKKIIYYALWHGRQFALVYFYRRRKITVLTSLSQDGEYQSKILKKLGYDIIKGKSGLKSLRRLAGLETESKTYVFAVDGPKGPIYEVKLGILQLAQKTGGIIIPVSFSVSRAKIFHKAWDKYILPYPFAKVIIIMTKPMIVSKEDNLSSKALILKQTLDEICKRADEIMKRKV